MVVCCGAAYDTASYTLAILATGSKTVVQVNFLLMIQLLKTKTGRLRIVGMLEGISLLLLLFVAVPAKYILGYTEATRIPGTIHGALFLLFIFNTMSVGVEQGWKFKETTWKVLLACIIPFGTFYIDKTILSKIDTKPAAL